MVQISFLERVETILSITVHTGCCLWILGSYRHLVPENERALEYMTSTYSLVVTDTLYLKRTGQWSTWRVDTASYSGSPGLESRPKGRLMTLFFLTTFTLGECRYVSSNQTNTRSFLILFNNAVRNLDYAASNGRIFMDHELERMWKEAVVA